MKSVLKMSKIWRKENTDYAGGRFWYLTLTIKTIFIEIYLDFNCKWKYIDW